MTIDKIKSAMQPELFNFWCNCTDVEKLNGARMLLLSEMRQFANMRDYKHIAEYFLLCHLTGAEREDYNPQN